MKIGILGGSFNPIHKGHLNMAKQVYEQTDIDQIWLMPSGQSPNKLHAKMATPLQRYEMCELVARQYDYLYAKDTESSCKEISYTYITLQKLTSDYPNDEFYFIMGADSLDYFDQWRHPEIIAKLAKILVINRDQFEYQDLEEKIVQIKELFPADIQVIHCDKMDVSSSEIRKMRNEKQDVSSFVSKEVLDYMNRHCLYE